LVSGTFDKQHDIGLGTDFFLHIKTRFSRYLVSAHCMILSTRAALRWNRIQILFLQKRFTSSNLSLQQQTTIALLGALKGFNESPLSLVVSNWQ